MCRHFDGPIDAGLSVEYVEPYAGAKASEAYGAGETYDYNLELARVGDQWRTAEVEEERSPEVGDEARLVFATTTHEGALLPLATVSAMVRYGEMNITIGVSAEVGGNNDVNLIDPDNRDLLSDLMTVLAADTVEHIG